MNDLISREMAIGVVGRRCGMCIQGILDIPAAQTEIIRCKDCKHHHRDNSGAYYCGRKDYGYGWGLNDFCSRAERRTDE